MDKYGLIGYPLGHSFSKDFFNDRFQSEGIDAEYINFEIPTIHDLPDVVENNPTLRGLNVTIPYKEKVLDYINNMDADYGEKIILFKSEYPADDTYNYDIIDYLNSREDISYEEMNAILRELGFTVSDDGYITWD